MNETLSIVYQDEHLVVINKPAGLLVHRSDVDRHAKSNAMEQLRDQLGQWVYPVHRLDKPTSGVLVFALNKETARLVGQTFLEQTVSKSYLALVRGFAPQEGRIDYALKNRFDKMTDRKAQKDKPAQPAVTDYQRLSTWELSHPVGRYSTARYSLLQVHPLTGRNRQIRRHLKHIFYPIVGDVAHGDGQHNTFFREHFNCHRLLLHAQSIQFAHPHTQAPLLIEAPLEESFQVVIDNLRANG